MTTVDTRAPTVVAIAGQDPTVLAKSIWLVLRLQSINLVIKDAVRDLLLLVMAVVICRLRLDILILLLFLWRVVSDVVIRVVWVLVLGW